MHLRRLFRAISKYQSHSTSGATSFAQYGALAALEQGSDFPKQMKTAFEERLEIACKMIAEIPGIGIAARPEGAFYIFLRLEDLFSQQQEIKNSVEFATALLSPDYMQQGYVAVVPGLAFGDDAAVRLSIATSKENLVEGLNRIGAFCQNLCK